MQSLKGRLAFVLISKLYRQMYANTGIATDSARAARSVSVARWLARVPAALRGRADAGPAGADGGTGTATDGASGAERPRYVRISAASRS